MEKTGNREPLRKQLTGGKTPSSPSNLPKTDEDTGEKSIYRNLNIDFSLEYRCKKIAFHVKTFI
jgi:hypothetical protein